MSCPNHLVSSIVSSVVSSVKFLPSDDEKALRATRPDIGNATRSVSTILRQRELEFKLGFLVF